jgi:hypothetical protein
MGRHRLIILFPESDPLQKIASSEDLQGFRIRPELPALQTSNLFTRADYSVPVADSERDGAVCRET